MEPMLYVSTTLHNKPPAWVPRFELLRSKKLLDTVNTQILKRFEGTVPQIQYLFHGSSSFVQNIYRRPMSSTNTVSGLSYSNHCSRPTNHFCTLEINWDSVSGIFMGGVYSMSNAVFSSITVTCASRTTVPFLPRHVAVGFTTQCSTLLCLQKNMNPKLHVFKLK